MNGKQLVSGLVVLCAVVLATGPASAAIVWDFANPPAAPTLDEVMQAGGIVVGDKLIVFSEVVTTKTQGTAAPEADAIKVTGVRYAGMGPGGWEYGLKFNGGWSAGTDEVSDTTIHFSVEVIDPELTQGWLIEDNKLSLSAFGTSDLPPGTSANDGGIVSVSENIYAKDPVLYQPNSPDNPSIANKFAYYRTDTNKDLYDEAVFAPLPKIWVIKDVAANGGDLDTGVAHLSEFYQVFSQVPEPSTLLLIGGAVLGARIARRRR